MSNKDKKIDKYDEPKIDTQKNLIVVEGEDDKRFIEAYLKYLEINDIDIKDINIQIFPIGGHTPLAGFAVRIAKVLNANNKVSIIFDANADYKERKEYVENQLKEHVEKQVDENIRDGRSIVGMVDIFLFPNNEGNGNLENLLEKIIKLEYKHIFECFKKYKKCLKDFKQKQLQRNEKAKIYVPNKKTKIYIYQYVLGEQGRGPQEFKTENWDFEHKEAQPLKKFLTEFVKKSTS